ncbi:DUF3298 domain-containing protein [Reyranella sp.]|uniref:DUF3298 domain-containing protein n=1 Tax=Reyranella sp. TaxID=1929291 RepID=UPI003BACE122
MRPIVFAVAMFLAGPALAQGGPSFDCSKASNAVERAVCRDPALAKADRDLAAAYAALSAKLTAAGKEQLEKDQVRWIIERNRRCTGEADAVAYCLKEQYAGRLGTLRALSVGPTPAISTERLANKGKVGKITWSYDIAYPRFDGANADFSALNAGFADASRKAAADATPESGPDDSREQEWTYEQSYTLARPDADAMTVVWQYYGFTGGAHGYGATVCTLVDLRTGAAVGPEGVFSDGPQWLSAMSEIVARDLEKQFKQKPGFEDALEPRNLAKLLKEPEHYCWRADRLELIFNAYEVGPYVSGPFEVDVPYQRLKPLLRADGPIRR